MVCLHRWEQALGIKADQIQDDANSPAIFMTQRADHDPSALQAGFAAVMMLQHRKPNVFTEGQRLLHFDADAASADIASPTDGVVEFDLHNDWIAGCCAFFHGGCLPGLMALL